MSREEALKRIKELRDEINSSEVDPAGWVNAVLYRLDQASDVIEFPVYVPEK